MPKKPIIQWGVTIRWGMVSSGQKPTHYTFSSEAEMDAFLHGVEEANGSMEYDILEATRNGETIKEST